MYAEVVVVLVSRVNHVTFWYKSKLRYSLTLLSPESDQHLISRYSNTVVSFTRITRIIELIANRRRFDCLTNSPCQYQKKIIENNMKKTDNS